jgi:sulfide dehydrogenase cytochrome subunit
VVNKMNLLKRSVTGASLLLILPLYAIPAATLAEDADVNRLLASQCAQCHGTNGYARGDMDGLAGDEDLAEDLLDMKGEDRPEDIMDHQALGYTNDQIRRIASYYAGLPEDQSGSSREDDD